MLWLIAWHQKESDSFLSLTSIAVNIAQKFAGAKIALVPCSKSESSLQSHLGTAGLALNSTKKCKREGVARKDQIRLQVKQGLWVLNLLE